LAGEDAVLYEVPLERLRARAFLAMGQPDEALAHIEVALKSAREQRLVHEEALLLLLEADATGDRLALEEAKDLLEGLGASASQFHRFPSPML
jgi:hypothetical protein